uniref:Uncharacterized protein n=1 Tax=Caenorhabditis tropicalis TaxID=1561998 RepID=A0A1I7TPF5_9PELO
MTATQQRSAFTQVKRIGSVLPMTPFHRPAVDPVQELKKKNEDLPDEIEKVDRGNQILLGEKPKFMNEAKTLCFLKKKILEFDGGDNGS